MKPRAAQRLSHSAPHPRRLLLTRGSAPAAATPAAATARRRGRRERKACLVSQSFYFPMAAHAGTPGPCSLCTRLRSTAISVQSLSG